MAAGAIRLEIGRREDIEKIFAGVLFTEAREVLAR
jgi:hypothetical protein